VSIRPPVAPGDRLGFVLQHKYCSGLKSLSCLSFPEALKGPDRVLFAALQQAGLKPRWAHLAAQQLCRCSTGIQYRDCLCHMSALTWPMACGRTLLVGRFNTPIMSPPRELHTVASLKPHDNSVHGEKPCQVGNAISNFNCATFSKSIRATAMTCKQPICPVLLCLQGQASVLGLGWQVYPLGG